MFSARAALVLMLLLQAGVGPGAQAPASRTRILLDEAHHNLYAAEAIALEVGRGRMVVVGEMGVLTDYSVREADNRRFALNIMRWLARELSRDVSRPRVFQGDSGILTGGCYAEVHDQGIVYGGWDSGTD
jgi:hypothetical protein